MRNDFHTILIALFFSLVMGCSSSDKYDPDTAEGGFYIGNKLEDDERYDEALVQYAEVRNQHPYSHFATEAEMRMADIQFKREAYIEAESGYKLFKEFHPRHPRIDYVTFRLGLSVFKQVPEEIDRDINLAHTAIRHLEDLISTHPDSEWIKEARKLRDECWSRLGQKELYIADYYFVRDFFEAALKRYEYALKNFKLKSLEVRALYGAIISAKEIDQRSKVQQYYQRMEKSYPNTPEWQKVKQEVSDVIGS